MALYGDGTTTIILNIKWVVPYGVETFTLFLEYRPLNWQCALISTAPKLAKKNKNTFLWVNSRKP
jgi:hypothetical protein